MQRPSTLVLFWYQHVMWSYYKQFQYSIIHILISETKVKIICCSPNAIQISNYYSNLLYKPIKQINILHKLVIIAFTHMLYAIRLVIDLDKLLVFHSTPHDTRQSMSKRFSQFMLTINCAAVNVIVVHFMFVLAWSRDVSKTDDNST